jgi:NAD(P)-dependent dehydrogenase (short-subunit alcohol dehydrogenase family)
MIIDLTNKTAVITGSTAGIGFAIARGLAAAGANVVINGRTQIAVDNSRAVLNRALPRAVVRGVAADLGTAEGCEALVSAEPSADILINNVGIYGPQDFFDIPDSEWTRFFEVNVMSGVRLSRAYLPGMLKRNWGRVVFMSSESAREYSSRHDSLRFHQDRQSRNLSRARQADRGLWRHGERRPARPDAVRGSRDDAAEER